MSGETRTYRSSSAAVRWLALLACFLFGAVGLVAFAIGVVSAFTGHYVWAAIFGFVGFMCCLAIRNVITPRARLVRFEHVADDS